MSEHILAHKHQAHKHQTHNHAAHGSRIHCGVEVTELSTNKQHTLSLELLAKHATVRPAELTYKDLGSGQLQVRWKARIWSLETLSRRQRDGGNTRAYGGATR
jgi:hypothetical protein